LPCAGEEAGVFFPLDGGANQCGSLACNHGWPSL
jgi:hypothetical protein